MVTAMAMGQGEWGNSNGETATAMIDQSITTGQWQQQLQWHWGRSNRRQEEWGNVVPIAIDRSCGCGRVGHGAWGAGVGILFKTLFETLVNAQMEVR
jgi:hypothetical protein